nr:glutaredoxin domain-containing protein [Candidatus Sigynarchaeota archaeon]
MITTIEIFTKTDCSKCTKLTDFLNKMGVQFVKRNIDVDPEAETDARMLNILGAPALRKGNKLLRVKDIFFKEQIIEDKIKSFVQN